MAEPEDSHPHLELRREEPVTKRRSGRPPPGRKRPPNFQSHANTLGEHLQNVRQATDEQVGGYDIRRLIKVKLTEKVLPTDVAKMVPGIQVISQEEDQLMGTSKNHLVLLS